jgi:16S rRNA processing protein RimM
MENSEEFITIGKITKSIGVRGNVKVIPITDFPEKFTERKKIFLFDENGNKFFKNKVTNSFEFFIEEADVHNENVSLKFKHVNDKDSSDELKDLLILIRENERVELPEGQYYFYDLIGFEFFDKEKLIGTVSDFENYGSDDLFVIESNDKIIYIPFRAEFIKTIDINKKIIIADLIEGFID